MSPLCYIRDKAEITHKLVALHPRVAPKHFQFALIRNEAKDCIQRGGFAGAVRADEAKDAALLNTHIDSVECDVGAVGLTQAACFYACHGFNFSLPDSGFGFAVAGSAAR